MRHLLKTILATWRDRRYAGIPEGCCQCGTGGPHYTGDGPQVTRYLYAGALSGADPAKLDWAACSSHPIPDWAPTVDYGRDVVVDIPQARAAVAAAVAGKPVSR
jgi:hypothetical protein